MCAIYVLQYLKLAHMSIFHLQYQAAHEDPG